MTTTQKQKRTIETNKQIVKLLKEIKIECVKSVDRALNGGAIGDDDILMRRGNNFLTKAILNEIVSRYTQISYSDVKKEIENLSYFI